MLGIFHWCLEFAIIDHLLIFFRIEHVDEVVFLDFNVLWNPQRLLITPRRHGFLLGKAAAWDQLQWTVVGCFFVVVTIIKLPWTVFEIVVDFTLESHPMCLHLRLAAHEIVSLVRFERDLRRSLQVQLPKIGGMTLRVTIFRNIADASEADFGGRWKLSFFSGYTLFLTHERVLSQQRSRFLRNWRRGCCLHGSILSTLFIWLHRRLSYDGKFAWWRLCLF